MTTEAQNSVVELQMACYGKQFGVFSSLHQFRFRFSSIVQLFQFAINLSAVSVCKRANNAQKVPQNAFLMLFFKKGI